MSEVLHRFAVAACVVYILAALGVVALVLYDLYGVLVRVL